MADDSEAPDCDLYRSQQLTIPSQGADGRQPHPSWHGRIYWCAHPKHSPRKRDQAGLGGAEELPCRGFLGKCPLTPAQHADW